MGKAADIHFPDVSAKLIRNSALIREIGGVGYYPTSAIPFVHVDTSGVRHWPRLPRLELAALFPNGKTRHRPRRGGPITKRDYKKAIARLNSKEKRLIQIARGEIRPDRPKFQAPIQVARLPEPAVELPEPSARPPAPAVAGPTAPAPMMATQLVAAKVTTAPRAQIVQAALSPFPLSPRAAKTPVAEETVERQQARFIVASADPVGDLIVRTAAAWMAEDEPVRRQKLHISAKARIPEAVRKSITARPMLAPTPAIARETPQPQQVAALAPEGPSLAPPTPEGWARAPQFDDDHDDELAYLPFPILPLMGERVDGEKWVFPQDGAAEIYGSSCNDGSEGSLPNALSSGTAICADALGERI